MYNKPELLLVGAAQNLVLGDSLRELGTFGGNCDTDDIENEATYVDHPGW